MPQFDNFPEDVWGRLKAWAKIVSVAPEAPTLEQCAAHVRRVATEISGLTAPLRPDVVEFYASETLQMIARLREDVAEPAS